MKKHNKIIFVLLITFIISGCGESARREPARMVEYVKPIKKKTINLSNRLGEYISILRNNDTIEYCITYNRNTNLNYIVDNFNDTVFAGTVTKLKSMYLLNSELDNGNFRIYAIEFTDSTITGMETKYRQSELMIDELKKGKFSDAIVDTSDQFIINPSKRTAAQIFKTVLQKLDAEKIIIDKELIEMINNLDYVEGGESNNVEEDENVMEDKRLIVKAYPNPIMDILNVETNNTTIDSEYKLMDASGKILKKGSLKSGSAKIDCTFLNTGIYFLVIKENDKTVKIIKK